MSVPSPYPSRNPFPYQATLSIEGTRIDKEADEESLHVRTLLLNPVRRLRDLTGTYLRRFLPSGKEHGQIVLMHGPHGSGKTHAIRYVMEEVVKQNLHPEEEIPEPTQIYAKAEGPDFIDIYRRMMKQIPLDLLQELAKRFLGVVAGEQFGRDRKDVLAGQRAVETFRKDPDEAYKMFRQYLIEAGAVQDRQAKEIGRITEGMTDFQRAFSYLLSTELSSAAYDWLRGLTVGPQDARKLGISRSITSSEVGKWAIQFVASLFSRAGRPLILYIDQYEKLVLDKSLKRSANNAGLLHSLVEVIPRENGMLVISGNEEAWKALARDLRQRFAYNVVEFAALSLNEAEDLIQLYAASTHTTLARGDAQPDTYPFEPDAVREIVRYSAGIPRRILQMCHSVFNEAPSGKKIGQALVEKTLREDKHKYLDRETIEEEIERLITERSLRFKKNYDIEGLTVDFAVLGFDRTPRLLIRINEALFHDDETRDALRSLNLVERAREREITAQVILVVLGYVSPEVTQTVRRFVHEAVVYDPDTFGVRFGELLDRVPVAAPVAPGSAKEQEKLERQLVEVRNALEKMARSRDAEVEELNNRLAHLLQRQATERLTERRKDIRRTWAEERHRLEERIQAVRSERRKRELEELERLRVKAESERRRRAVVFGFPVTTLGILAPILARFVDLYVPFLYEFGWVLGLFATVVVGTMLLRAFNFLGPAWERELASPVSCIADLERLAQLLVDVPKARQLLRHSNPQFRYMGALAASPKSDSWPLIEAVRTEPSSLVRRALAKRIGQSSVLSDMPFARLVQSVPEIAYVVEAGAERKQLPKDLLSALPPPLRTLAMLSGAEPEGKDGSLALQLAAALQGRRSSKDVIRALAEAFEKGIDDKSSKALHSITGRGVREALEELSPFDEGGLGTLDELRNIKMIDQYYLFFRELLHLMERDLLTNSQTA